MNTRPHGDTGRAQFLDAARGAAMFFVLLSHFSAAYFRGHFDEDLPTTLSRIGMIASPTFTIISGLLAGFLYVTAACKFTELRTKLIDRGLFLLTIGHIVIAGAFLDSDSHAVWELMRTDSIGVCLIVGSLIMGRVSGAARLTSGLLLYALSWVALGTWEPHSAAAANLRLVLFGSFSSDVFPIVPWLAVYLVSTVFGERIARHLKSENPWRAVRQFATVGAVGIAAAVGLKVLQHLTGVLGNSDTFLSHLSYVGQKYPPGPLYVLFYGGTGLAILAAWLAAELSGYRRALTFMATYGQASFFIFVLQFYMFDVVRHLPLMPVAAWPVTFGICCLIAGMLGRVWERADCNRVMTVGYQWAVKRHAEAAAQPQTPPNPVAA